MFIDFLATFWGKVIGTFVISMVPVIELRGAIPIAIQSYGLAWPIAYLVSVLGNMVPVPFILLFLRRVFQWLGGFEKTAPLIKWFEKHAHTKGRTVTKYAALGLFILVAIPLPGTGAWTGALVAAILDMRMTKAVPSIFLGVVVAGAAVTALTLGVIQVFA